MASESNTEAADEAADEAVDGAAAAAAVVAVAVDMVAVVIVGLGLSTVGRDVGGAQVLSMLVAVTLVCCVQARLSS